jgi:hypothetical protein
MPGCLRIRRVRADPLLAVKFEAILHFEGPLFKWNGKVDEREIIARRAFRWKWLAEGWAQGRLRGMERCKYIVVPICDPL